MRAASYIRGLVIVFAALAAAGGTARAGTVTGSVDLPSVVWISDGSTAPQTETQMHNQDRQFVPDLVVIRAGSDVRFPNDDPFFHSIYSSSNVDPFDIGYYGMGPGKLVHFASSAVVEVHCHIHPKMRGMIVVTDGPGSTGPVSDFKIENVLAGTHELHYWNARDGVKTFTIVVPAEGSLDAGKLR